MNSRFRGSSTAPAGSGVERSLNLLKHSISAVLYVTSRLSSGESLILPLTFSTVTGKSASGAATLNVLTLPHDPITNGYPTYSVFVPVSRAAAADARISLLYSAYLSDSGSQSVIEPVDSIASDTDVLPPNAPLMSIALPDTGLGRYSMRFLRLTLVSRDCRLCSVSTTSERMTFILTGFCSASMTFKNPTPYLLTNALPMPDTLSISSTVVGASRARFLSGSSAMTAVGVCLFSRVRSFCL